MMRDTPSVIAPSSGWMIPEGFAESKSRGPFSIHNGPSYRAVMDGDFRCGLRVLERHCNSMGFLHGGMLSSFADSSLAWAVSDTTRRRMVTLKLSIEFMQSVRVGDWLVAHPIVDNIRDDMVFVHAPLIINDRHQSAQAQAVFRLLSRRAPNVNNSQE